jgi:hypothetical protein
MATGYFDQKGDRASPALIPAAQQDLIIPTLEVLTRDRCECCDVAAPGIYGA